MGTVIGVDFTRKPESGPTVLVKISILVLAFLCGALAVSCSPKRPPPNKPTKSIEEPKKNIDVIIFDWEDEIELV